MRRIGGALRRLEPPDDRDRSVGVLAIHSIAYLPIDAG
jgi:hypothetical protein